MNVVQLASYGFPDYFIDTWRDSGIKQLFPCQVDALHNDVLFSARNLVISAPTASGKTFLGEMAAVKTILNSRQVIYLVPLRSLAEEKFQEFFTKYNEYGLRVLISTGEKIENDKDISQGKFDLAVIVYEKLLSLIATRPTLLNLLGLVVIDELQNLGQGKRGLVLEYIICLLRKYPGIKIVGLSAVIPTPDPIIQWLDADLCHSTKRPHELREGVLMDQVFYYQEFNSGEKGEENLGGQTSLRGPKIPWNIALDLAEKGQQSVIFLPDKQSTRSLALELSQAGKLQAAKEVIEELQLLEPTTSTTLLLVTLKGGIAFHNADLTLAERQIIEKFFKSGHITLLTATTTLAMGVNLPANNVFIDPHLWRFDPLCKRPYLDILTKNEKENEAGRAGRFGSRATFGRMIITATSPREFDAYWNTYIENDFQCTTSTLTPRHIAPLVLWLICGTSQNVGDLESFFQSTYAHFIAQAEKRPYEWKTAIKEALHKLAILDLVFVNSLGRITPSRLAKIAAVKCISASTAVQLQSWLKTVPGRPVSDLEILYCACLTENGSDFYLSLENRHYLRVKYYNYLQKHLSVEALNCLNETFGDQPASAHYCLREAKIAVMLRRRLSGEPTLNLENNTRCLGGEIIRMAEHIAWILGSAALISQKIIGNASFAKRLFTLKERLVFGVEESSLPLARLRLPSLGRVNCQRLNREGIDSLQALQEVNAEFLGNILGEKVAHKVIAQLAAHHPQPADTPIAPTASPRHFAKDTIEITNLYRGRHYFINVNGQTVQLTRRLFEIILRLSLEVKKNGEGWVHKLDEAISDERLSLITKLRSHLKPYLRQNPKSVIESDQFGSLRISLPPQNLLFDHRKFSNHPHEFIRQLIENYERA